MKVRLNDADCFTTKTHLIFVSFVSLWFASV